ncbi:MAG: MFS transporter [Chitinophagaceae bacterium]|nr:MFS transporter [Chitinophagaceae bacterium]
MLQPSIQTTATSDTKRRIKAITGGSIGNLVEWYDWYSYSAFALYFSPVFFPSTDRTAQLLNAAGIFAVGFLMRPIGGWLFGSIADKAGRKKAMTLSILLMSFGSLLIACTPGYASIGVAAPVLLFVARLLQGLSVGGEYGTSATYLSEMASADRRGFYSSFQYVTLIGGQLIALGIQLLLQKFLLTPEQLHAWGWRIPFIIGALLAVVAFYIRSNLEETASFEYSNRAKENKGTLRELLKHPRAIATVVGLTLGGTIAFYTYSVYMQKFLVNTVKLSIDQSTLISFFSLLFFALLQPAFGFLSDKIGRKPLLIGFGILGSLCTVPLLTAISTETSMGGAFFLIMCGLLIVSGYTSINAVVKAELFPAEIRALGVGLPYALTTAIFGGTAEVIALYFKQQGHETWFYWYVTGCILISLLVYAFMKDSKTYSKITV